MGQAKRGNPKQKGQGNLNVARHCPKGPRPFSEAMVLTKIHGRACEDLLGKCEA